MELEITTVKNANTATDKEEHTNNMSKTPKQTKVETRYLMMPQHLNQHGTLFGGAVMSWIDSAAAMAAQRHAGNDVVTASIDKISFHAPAKLGDQIVLQAVVTYAGKTSMEVEVEVFREDPVEGEIRLSTRAYLTFVAVDEEHKPVTVPALLIETDEEEKKHKEAVKRVNKRREERNNQN